MRKKKKYMGRRQADVLDVGSNKYKLVLGSPRGHRSTPLLRTEKEWRSFAGRCLVAIGSTYTYSLSFPSWGDGQHAYPYGFLSDDDDNDDNDPPMIFFLFTFYGSAGAIHSTNSIIQLCDFQQPNTCASWYTMLMWYEGSQRPDPRGLNVWRIEVKSFSLVFYDAEGIWLSS